MVKSSSFAVVSIFVRNAWNIRISRVKNLDRLFLSEMKEGKSSCATSKSLQN